MLYRGMRRDSADPTKPACGANATTLGVREKDIPITGGLVYPATGGMSVVCDDPNELPPHRKPESRGGTARGVAIFEIHEVALPVGLSARADMPDFPAHRSVEPSAPCAFEEYVGNLHASRDFWAVTV